uniref:Uncharacterized protein n=1 Tax=Phaeocystis antarctica TaxID=33657 RepID=A0A7S0HU94_9EUKA
MPSLDANSFLHMQQAMYCNSDQAKLNAKQIIDNKMKTSGLSSASSLPNAQLVECLCQSSWDLNDPSFAMAMTAMSGGDMDPAALFDKIEVMLPLMGSASNLCSPTCKVAIQAYISAATEMDTAAYTQAGLSQEVAAIAGMADTAQEVECLCAFDLTSMLHDLKPLLLQAMALSKQAAAASQQPALLGQDGHGQYQPALLGQDGHGQYQGQGQGQGPGIGRRLEGLPSSKADIATMLADEQSAVGGMFDSQSAMLGSIAAMYIVKKATSPGGMCPSICTAGSGGAPPASNCDVPLHGKGGGGEGSPAPPSDKAGKGGKGEALSSSLLSIEAKKAEYSKSQALGTSACPGGGGGGGDATAAAVIFALLFVASSTAAFYFYRKAELGGRAKTAQAAISNAQAGSEATIWRIDPLSPAQGADNLRPPQQM